ncbi:acyl-CoA dehydrogenase family protein [Rhodococcus sp. NPDC059968]|uniref:acyl-CoA dehydrogenase family protein n=1 Tax=Rhodococcus sp. NPDC059968 TaxID=3347017 RepID=UPI003670BE01
MDYVLSEEQRALQTTTRAILESEGGTGPARRVAEAPSDSFDEFDGRLLRAASTAGWLGLGIAEERGGSGGSTIEQLLVAIELGRTVAPLSLFGCALTAEFLARVDKRNSDLLTGIADGSVRPSWALTEKSRPWQAEEVALRGTSNNGGLRLNGSKCYAVDADSGTMLLVTARTEHADLVVAAVDVDAAGVHIERQQTLDLSRHLCRVDFDDCLVGAEAILATGSEAEWLTGRVLRLGALLAAAESLGVAERLLELTVSYAKERVQFGQPIGSLQAIKHKCADLRIRLEGARTLLYVAAMHHDRDTPSAARYVHMAKANTNDAAVEIAGEALQIHGGIGMTWEHDLHLFLRRARVNAVLFGTTGEHRRAALACALHDRAVVAVGAQR